MALFSCLITYITVICWGYKLSQTHLKRTTKYFKEKKKIGGTIIKYANLNSAILKGWIKICNGVTFSSVVLKTDFSRTCDDYWNFWWANSSNVFRPEWYAILMPSLHIEISRLITRSSCGSGNSKCRIHAQSWIQAADKIELWTINLRNSLPVQCVHQPSYQKHNLTPLQSNWQARRLTIQQVCFKQVSFLKARWFIKMHNFKKYFSTSLANRCFMMFYSKIKRPSNLIHRN